VNDPERGASADPLMCEVVEQLRGLLHACLTASVPAWLDLQLTLPQLRTVFIVAHHGPSSVMQVAQYLGIGEPTASHLVEKLVRAGLVDRRTDPQDRRRAIVRLTPAGEARIHQLLGWEHNLTGWLQQVPDADLARFQHGLQALMQVVHGQATDEGRAAAAAAPEGVPPP
jgi:MarR family transcriptional regulator, organic hydroperoxide resistance regulator